MNEIALHEVDVCVVGGGMAGLIAALAAARTGASTLLMHDRPVLGGNASSECRVHICGADRHNNIKNMRETGILEELRLANVAANPHKNYSIWDLALYDACRRQSRLSLLLNCSCCDAQVEGPKGKPGHIVSIAGWQLTTYTRHVVRAKVYVDCSGDAILAGLTGAAFRVGREGRAEFGEPLAPEQPDLGTMGMTLAWASRAHESPQAFTPPPWARRIDRCEELPDEHRRYMGMGYWWQELGGMHQAVADTEKVRDDLLGVSLGVWDHIKNAGDHGAANLALDWLQFLPAKRESRRYVGRHMLRQQEIDEGGRFGDVVCYGGWTIDEHPPIGFPTLPYKLEPANFHNVPSPYGIPYGSLVHRDVDNLMFAGRCASCTHIGMSSTRVMGTGSSMGQAAGTAAAMAARRGISPAELGASAGQLQQLLLRDDAYLPGVAMQFGELTMQARYVASSGDAGPLRDGVNRPVGQDEHAWHCRVGDSLEIQLGRDADVGRLCLVADSSLHRNIQLSLWGKYEYLGRPPETLLRDARLEVLANGRWESLPALKDNIQRLIPLPVLRRCQGLRLTLDRTWRAEQTRLFAAWVE